MNDDRFGLAGARLFRPRQWHRLAGFPWPLGLGLAVALTAFLVHRVNVNRHDTRHGTQLDAAVDDLVTTVGTRRFLQARLAEPFYWGPLEQPQRGTRRIDVPIEIQQAALRLERAGRDAGVPGLRGVALARLVVGDVDEAIRALQDLLTFTPDNSPAHVDLAAALIARGTRDGQPLDLANAIEQTQHAAHLTPESNAAIYNEAVALEALGLSESAEAAWRSFVRADPASAWAREAMQHIERLALDKDPAPSLAVGAVPGVSGTVSRDAVEADAFAAYTSLERDILPRWAAAVQSGSDFPLERAASLSLALVRSGRDAYLPRLVAAAQRSRTWPRSRRRAMAGAIAGVFRWRALIDAGDYDAAERLAPETVSFFAVAGVDDAEAQVELAYSDLVAGRTQKAVARLEPVGARAARNGYWRVAARSRRLRALAVSLDTRMAESLSLYETGRALAERSGDIELCGMFDSFLAEEFDLLGDRVSAWRHLGAALARMSQFETNRQRYDTLSDAVTAARDAGLTLAARRFAEALLVATQRWSNPEGQITARLEHARTLSDLNAGDEGVADVEQAITLLPLLASRPQAQRRLGAEIDALSSYCFAGRDDVRALAAASRAIAYFTGSVRIRLAELLLQRGRIYMRLGQGGSAERDWRAGIAILENQRLAIRDEQLRVSRTARLWGLFDALIEHLKSDSRKALEIAERSRARELLYSLAPGRAPDLLTTSDLQQALPERVDALVFAQLPSSLLVWKVTRSEVTLVERPVASAAMRRLVMRANSEAASGVTRAALDELGALLLPAELDFSAIRALVLVPDDVLNAVPFAALSVGARGRPLVGVTIPVVAPSLSTFAVAARQSTRIRHTAPHILAIGVSSAIPGAKLPVLPNAVAEATRVSSMYEQHDLLRDDEATGEAVTAALPRATVFHFAGHAEVDEHFPSRSRLVLSRGPGLTAVDIATLHLRPGIVAILGACETAAGSIRRGEGPMSLARSFLAGGASSVIASLWDVRDDDTSALLLEVHRNLLNGREPAESLAEAQRLMIRKGRPFSAWSGFVAIGGISM